VIDGFGTSENGSPLVCMAKRLISSPGSGFAGALHVSGRDPPDKRLHTRSGNPGQFAFLTGDPVEKFQGGFFVSPGQVEAVRVLFCQISFLETFHEKGNDDCCGDGVDAVVVAEPVGLHDEFRVPYVEVGTECGSGFILGAVHPDLRALFPACFQRYEASLGAPQIAARETSVIAAVLEQVLLIIFPAYFVCPGIGSQLVVLHGKGLIGFFVHECDQPGRAFPVHPQRVRVNFPDYLLKPCSRLFYLDQS
jgi:hypothetical protein